MRQKHSSDFKEMDYKVLLRHCNSRCPREKFDIVLSCWDIHGGKQWSKHCGKHTEIMHACCESAQFATITKICRDQSELLWETGRNDLRVVCVCNQGRHRSVAISSILSAVYREMGFNTSEPTHLSKHSWWEGMCDKCRDCRPNAKKDKLFKQLARSFSTISG